MLVYNKHLLLNMHGMNIKVMFLLVYFVVEVILVYLSVHSKTLNWLQAIFHDIWGIKDRL